MPNTLVAACSLFVVFAELACCCVYFCETIIISFGLFTK